MKNMVLIAAALMVLVVGFLAITMLGRVLARQRERNAVEPLRVGMPHHMTADSIKKAERAFAAAYPNVPLEMVCRSHAELLRELEEDQLDVILTGGNERFPSAEEFHIRGISGNRAPESAETGRDARESNTKAHTVQYALWRRNPRRCAADGFVDCLTAAEAEDSARQKTMI